MQVLNDKHPFHFCESDSSGNHSETDEINMLVTGRMKLNDAFQGSFSKQEDFGFEEQNSYETPESKIKI